MVSLLLAEASTSEEEHFKLILVQTEMERAKYLVRSYLRTRLAKVRPLSPYRSILLPRLTDQALGCDRQVEKFAQLFTLAPTMQPLLSPLELAHAQKSVQTHLIRLPPTIRH